MLSASDIVNSLVGSLIENLTTLYGDRFPEPAQKLLNGLGFMPESFSDQLHRVLKKALQILADEYPELSNQGLLNTVVSPLLTQTIVVAFYEDDLYANLTTVIQNAGDLDLVALQRAHQLDLVELVEDFQQALHSALVDEMEISDVAVTRQMKRDLRNQIEGATDTYIAYLEDRDKDLKTWFSEQIEALKDSKVFESTIFSYHAFISYARADAREFAVKLKADLEKKGIRCWLDTEDMPSIDTFIAEIGEAIEKADYFLLINTPGAIKSPYCRDEWKKALEAYKPILPITLIGAYNDLPEQAFTHLRDALDFTEHTNPDVYATTLERLTEKLGIKPHPAGRLEGAPSLLSRYLTRSTELAEVAEILTRHKTTVLTSAIKGAGIQGMGGIGKTVLATALTRDYFVRRNFKDGIYWITFGTNPDISSLWTKLRNWLGGGTDQFDSWEEARDFFQEATQNRECLIVLDDVWGKEHTRAFTRLGEKTRLLITSRFRDVIEAVDAQNYELGVLSDEHSIGLFAQTADLEVNELPDIASQLVKHCGNLPLAISMIGAMVRGKPETYWHDALDALQVADLEDISAQFPEYPYPNLFAAIQVSIDALDDETCQHYYDFAIFPDDVDIPEDVPITFWQPIKARKVRRILDDLVNRNLLKRNQDGSLSLHDLQLSFIRKQVNDKVERHNRFLDKYNPKGATWHTVADDYLLRNLAYHLDVAERRDELFDTLTQSPDWMKVKFQAFLGDTSYLSDLEQTITYYPDNTPDHIHKLAQLWTARSMVNGRTTTVTDNMLKAMVLIDKHIEKTGQRIQEALGYASLRPDAKKRFNGLLTIYEQADFSIQQDDNLIDQLKEIALSIEDVSSKAWALSDLAAKLADTQDFEQARKIADSIEDVSSKATTLSDLAAKLAQADDPSATQVFEQAQTIALSIELAPSKAMALFSLAVDLAGIHYFEQAQTIALSIEDASSKTIALSALAAKSADTQHFEQARKIADSIENASFKAWTLSDLATKLAQADDPSATQVFEQAQAIALSIEDAFLKSRALSDLATKLAQADDPSATQVFEQAQTIADSIEDVFSNAETLSDLATKLTQADDPSATQVFEQASQDMSSKAGALSHLAAKLADTQHFEQAREIADSIENASSKARALRDLAAKLADTQHFEQAREIADSIEHASSKSQALSHLAAKLAQADDPSATQVFEQAQTIALSIEDVFLKSRALSDLSAKMADTQHFEQAQTIALSIEDESIKAGALMISDVKKMNQNPQEFEKLQDSIYRLLTVTNSSTKLAEIQHLEQARKIADAVEDVFSDAETLSDLATKLADTQQFSALDGAFNTLGVRDTLEMFQMMITWQAGFDGIEDSLWYQVMRDVCRIISWTYPQYKELEVMFVKIVNEMESE